MNIDYDNIWYSSCCSATSNEDYMQFELCPKCGEHCNFERIDKDGNIIETYP